jgi:poly(beta-D-mannuronate) lyase
MNTRLLLLSLIGAPLLADPYLTLDFESDTVGAQPTGNFEYSPSSNDATNGTVVIDGTSTPANPLSGQSLYVYDQSGSPTHFRTDFAGGANVENVRVSFQFQRTFATTDDDDTGIKVALAPAGTATNNSDFRPFELRLLNDGRVRMNSADGTATAGSYLTDTSNSIVLFYNGHDTETLSIDDSELGSLSVAANSVEIWLNGALLGEYPGFQTPDPVNAPQIDFYAQAEDVGRFGLYQDSGRQGGIAFDDIVIEPADGGSPGSGGETVVYYETDFEADTVDAQPQGPFAFSPSSNDSTNGFVVVDGSSTPANPLSGQSLYMYDLNGDGNNGESSRLDWDFKGGANVSKLRVDFDFQRMYSVDEADTDTRFHFGVARAGDQLNNSDFRPFEVRMMNNGGFWVQSGDGSEQATTYDTANPNHLTLLMNSHDTVSAAYSDATLGSGSLAPNTVKIFLNDVEVGSYAFLQTPDPTNAPQIDFYAQDDDLGKVGFYQDSKRQGGIVIDNLRVADLAAPANPPVAPSGLTAVANGSDQIDLAWTDNSSDEIGFVIQRKSGTGDFTTIAEVAADVTSYSDTGLDAETAYTYRVRSTNGTLSDPTTEASATTAVQLLPAVDDLSDSSTVISGNTATVSVTASGQSPLSYQWYFGESGDTSNPISGATDASFTTDAITAETRLWVNVTNNNGSAASDTIVLSVYLPQTISVDSASSFTSAMAGALPGDVIEIAPGEYANWTIEVEGQGTADAPITVRAAQPGKTILTGSSRLEISGSYLVVSGLAFVGPYTGNEDQIIQFRGDLGNAEFCRLTETALYEYVPASGFKTFWVNLFGRENRVDHNLFRGQNARGVTVVAWLDGQPNDHRIDHNHFHDRIVGGENEWESIRIGTSDTSMSVSRTLVESNLFSYVDGEIEIISNKSGENVYRGNTFFASQGTLTLRHGDDCLVEGNFFLGNDRSSTGGVRVIGENHRILNNYFKGTTGRGDGAAISIYAGVPNSALNEYFAAHNTLVAFNTIVDVNSAAISVGAGFGSSDRTVLPTGVTIAHNVIFDDRYPSAGDFIIGEQPENATFTGNLAFGHDLGVANTGWTIADPLLAYDEASGFERPGTGSPVIDVLSDVAFGVDTDIDGQARDASPDLGADEVSTATGNEWIGPLTTAQTGPSWVGPGRYRPVLEAPVDWVSDAEQSSDEGEFESAWFGNYSAANWPWVLHADHGWIYGSNPAGTSHIFYYDLDLGWVYTTPTDYPWIYSYADGGWFFYSKGTQNPRWFYDYNAGAWSAR